MNNRYAQLVIYERRKTISTKTTPIGLQKIRRYAAPLLIIPLILNLIGCTPATATEPPETLPTLTATVELPSSTFTPPPTGTPVPTATQTPFVPKAVIKIAVHVPLSGGQAVHGTDLMRAADIAIQQLSMPIQELGYKVELVTFDDESSIDIAEANAHKIVADPEILCGVGHYNSRVTIQATEIYHVKGLAFIAPANTSTTITDRGYLEVSRVVGRDDGQGIAGAQFAKSQDFKRVYTIGNSSLSSRKNIDYFQREAARIGLSVVGMFTTDETDSEGTIRRMMASNPDLVYFASTVTEEAALFFKKARDAGYVGVFLGTSGANSPSLAKTAGSALTDGGGTYFTDMVASAGYYPEANQFVQDFLKSYGSFPQSYAAQAYDATGICLKAIEEASKAKGGEIPTRREVANAIRALKDYKGITGTFNFDKKGDPVMAKYFVVKVVSANFHDWNQNTVAATFEIAPP